MEALLHLLELNFSLRDDFGEIREELWRCLGDGIFASRPPTLYH